MKTFKNKHFTKRNYECSNIVACEAETAPNDNYVPCDRAVLKGLEPICTEAGVRFYGYL